MSTLRICRLPPRANVPAQRTRWTNAFAAARGDKSWRPCGLLLNYFGHIIIIIINRWLFVVSTCCREPAHSTAVLHIRLRQFRYQAGRHSRGSGRRHRRHPPRCCHTDLRRCRERGPALSALQPQLLVPRHRHRCQYAPVITAVGQCRFRLLVLKFYRPLYWSRPTQPPILSGTGNEYRPECGDALRPARRPGISCRFHSIRG